MWAQNLFRCRVWTFGIGTRIPSIKPITHLLLDKFILLNYRIISIVHTDTATLNIFSKVVFFFATTVILFRIKLHFYNILIKDFKG